MFRLSAEPIDDIALKAGMIDARAGAYVSFEGWVRNHNEGHAVTRLDYEAYEGLCLTEAAKILEEARERFEILDAHCVHRTGSLAIGEMAVWVGVTSAHRKAAFEACEYVINQVKSRLPIWKKEFYENGDSGWINCQTCAGHRHAAEVSASQYYARQQLLKEVGLAGQEKLQNSRVLVVGAGGLGCGVLPYLAAAGVGHLAIVDDDMVDLTNLHRQVLYTVEDVGQPKAVKATERLQSQNPLIHVEAYPFRLTPENANKLLSDYDVVLDCSDNFETQFLLNDTAVRLGIPLLQASIYQFEGELQWISPRNGSACLRCLWPEVPAADCVGTCAEVGVLGAVPGVFGTLQAMETLKYLLGLPTPLLNQTLLFDLQTLSQKRIQRAQNPQCPVCGPHLLQGIAPDNKNQYPWVICGSPELEFEGYRWIDVREPWEITEPLPVAGAEAMPYSQTNWQTVTLETDRPIILVCSKGYRSRLIAEQLQARGILNVYSLEGGIRGLAADVPIIAALPRA